MRKEKMLWVFLALLPLAGCRENRRNEEKKEAESLAITERTDAPMHDALTVAKHFHLGYTKEELAAFGPPPAPRPGYVTFFDPGWKMRKFRYFWDHAAFLELELPKQYPHITTIWLSGRAHEREDRPCYRQLRMGPVKESFGKRWKEQCAFLSSDDEVPTLRQVVAAFAIHYAIAGETPFPPWCTLRCAQTVDTTDGSGSPAVVMVIPSLSGSESATLWSDTVSDEEHRHPSGLLSARRLP